MIGATYRLQFREGVTFATATSLAPHLGALGITHLYASPIFAATIGSTHGYDVTDHNRFDPVLGTAEDFEAMVAALSAHGVSLMLDIVPNHMAASTENPWWRDVLKHGAASLYARHFDIDWSAGKLVIPVLGAPYGEALAEGLIERGDHPEWGPVLTVPGHALPLAPGTEAIADVHACHEAQAYRLTHRRLARDGLTYRRFFEVADLVGVRVEDPAVFQDVHGLVAGLVADGKVTALRLDHVDGLCDPAGYLEALRARCDVPLLVEKILEGDETLPDWPVEGTTGYEFMAAMAALFVDADGLERLSEDYAKLDSAPLGESVAEAKREIATRNLAGELRRLVALALAIFADDLTARDHGEATIRDGLVALLTAMPVYRTYLTGAPSPRDKALIETVVRDAPREGLEDDRILHDLAALLLGKGATREDPRRAEFVQRFEQMSGPLTAKALEDTLFYRRHRLLGLNEVGSSLAPELGPARFFQVAGRGGLAATQTHDTKRGEDARARLFALSDPSAAAAWPPVVAALPDAPVPKLRWAFAQMLFASAPLDDDPDFTDRFREAALKSVREAKEDTSWTAQNAAFETAVATCAEAMVAARQHLAPLERVTRAGAVIGLAQALLKVTTRPAPDIYQGTMAWDFSMVDPDNRRPVDFDGEAHLCTAARHASLDSCLTHWRDARAKARVLTEALTVRRERPALFAGATVRRLTIEGPLGQVALAFSRSDAPPAAQDAAPDTAIVVVPLRPLPMLGDDGLHLRQVPAGRIELAQPLQDRFTGEALGPGSIDLAGRLARWPVFLATSWPSAAPSTGTP